MITEKGYQLIKKRLSELEKNSKVIADKLSYARLDGDLSENADWIILRENLEIAQDKINKMRTLLENSDVISKSDHEESLKFIQVGSNVSYCILKSDGTLETKESEIEITSEMDSDPFVNKVSDQSPFGASLIGKEVGDIVEVTSPKVSNNYKVKVLKIS